MENPSVFWVGSVVVGKPTLGDVTSILLVTCACRWRGMGERDAARHGNSRVGETLNVKHVHQCLGSNTAVESCKKRCESDVKKKVRSPAPSRRRVPFFSHHFSDLHFFVSNSHQSFSDFLACKRRLVSWLPLRRPVWARVVLASYDSSSLSLRRSKRFDRNSNFLISFIYSMDFSLWILHKDVSLCVFYNSHR